METNCFRICESESREVIVDLTEYPKVQRNGSRYGSKQPLMFYGQKQKPARTDISAGFFVLSCRVSLFQART